MGDRLARRRVGVLLEEWQVDAVLRAVGEQESSAGAGADMESVERDELEVRLMALRSDKQLSNGLLAGLHVFYCFPADRTARGPAEVGRQVGLSTSSAFRYIRTLTCLGLLEHDPVSRLYRLAVAPAVIPGDPDSEGGEG
jgi:IclR helix-turn-helix domain